MTNYLTPICDVLYGAATSPGRCRRRDWGAVVNHTGQSDCATHERRRGSKLVPVGPIRILDSITVTPSGDAPESATGTITLSGIGHVRVHGWVLRAGRRHGCDAACHNNADDDGRLGEPGAELIRRAAESHVSHMLRLARRTGSCGETMELLLGDETNLLRKGPLAIALATGCSSRRRRLD